MSINTEYENFLRRVFTTGALKSDRTGTGTLSVFGHQMRFDLRNNVLPIITTKKVFTKAIIIELIGFLLGKTNAQWYQERGCTIWDEWALKEDKVVVSNLQNYERAQLYAEKMGISVKAAAVDLNDRGTLAEAHLACHGIPNSIAKLVREKGDLGPIYGHQWRSWSTADGKGIDQMTEVLRMLREDPDSRRIIVSAWNVADLPKMALAPCHAFFQFWTREMGTSERINWVTANLPDFTNEHSTLADLHAAMDAAGVPKRALSCQLYQRSADLFLGVPFNVTSYSLLTHMVAQQVNMVADEFIWVGGDCHVYSNHFDQVQIQLKREVLPFPKLELKKAADLFSYTLDDIGIVGYEHHPAIKAPVAV